MTGCWGGTVGEVVGHEPFAAMPFKGRIEETIRREAERLLA